MDVKIARRMSETTERSVFKRLGGGYGPAKNKVCTHWLAGRCNRNPCKFMHRECPPPQPKQPHAMYNDHRTIRSNTWRNPNYYSPKYVKSGEGVKSNQETQQKISTSGGVGTEVKVNQKTQQKISTNGGVGTEVESNQKAQQKISTNAGDGTDDKRNQKTQNMICKYWISGNCVHGDKCKDLHSWFYGNGFSMLAKLEGHSKAVTGIALPSGSDKLYSGSMDKSVRVWDCHTGQCAGVINLGCEIGSLFTEGPWVFVGLPNAIKACNIQTQSEHVLDGPVGQVHAMAGGIGVFFAGTEDGTILAWKYNSEASRFELAGLLKGHSRAVLSLVIGAGRLYSGSMDKTIRVWDLETMQCIQTLEGHTDAVMSVICWDSYLLSGSLDNTIKIWAATESGSIEVIHEHKEESGVLAFCGIHDAEVKPILLCSCNDDTVRLYDLPSFHERGRIFAKRNVRVIQIGTGGLFFTGDATGQLSVWKLH